MLLQQLQSRNYNIQQLITQEIQWIQQCEDLYVCQDRIISRYGKGESMELHLECIEELKKTLCFAVCYYLPHISKISAIVASLEKDIIFAVLNN